VAERRHDELAHRAFTDRLTGLYSYDFFAEALEHELGRVRRYGGELSLLLLDLDRFKAFNDQFGHLEGDHLLREAGDVWRSVLRVSDFLARAGGEEFVLLLPDCSRPVAHEVLERMRAVTPKGQTFSTGLARWDGIEPSEELLDRADQALYEAKHAGRDRTVVAAQPPLGMTPTAPPSATLEPKTPTI
jgi:diguanylate cyclase (GGDEF)-like protein